MNSNQFNHISINGYRRLFSIDVQMRPLTVMIGANGVGKTAFLEVLSLLAASANGQLASKISDLGGISDILTFESAESLKFKLSMEVPEKAPIDYALHLDLKGDYYDIETETLVQERQYIDRHGPTTRYYDALAKKFTQLEQAPLRFETFLSQLPKMFTEPENFRSRLAQVTYYGAYALNVGPKSPLRLPQKMQPTKSPGKNGEYLVSYLYYMREMDKYRFEMLEDSLKAAFPSFKGLNFPPVAAGMLALTWHDKNFSTPLYMHQLSEGTLRFLWLATLLQCGELTAVTLIDEPEVSLHPELLSLLSELMREASERTQLIVATHSDRLISFLEPHEVLIMDADEAGLTKMRWADDEELDLEHWLEDYRLDELWRMGCLGGRA
ncbi:ABC transporter ATP-binding protein [Candidatus Thiomargarita nelsonii]|uniref:ABC transporter ATP-binding protein n=1 Tax=Candidatus Thiomargarita nelsonii TaxID=1003181 RepID=A0A0A6S3B7_9GAMM|nr:ABC transporter ATP-binding protein [Candidatus Thiomargarita nelsonii]